MIVYKQKLIRIGNEIYCDIRSDEIALCRKKKQDLRIVVGNEYVDIPYGKLRHGRQVTKEEFTMIYFPFEKYTLISYKWVNAQKLTPLQIKLLT